MTDKIQKNKTCKFSLNGSILVQTLVFAAIALTVIGGLVGRSLISIKASRYTINREQAMQIAEAGIDYYRWHLAHNSSDYHDGQGAGSSGPYVHDFNDESGNPVGKFSLEIIPPLAGSTVVEVHSTGWINSDPSNKRSISARLGMPSLASYSFLANGNVWFGDTETTHGKVFSNGGIHMDGSNDAQVISAQTEYACKPAMGCGSPQQKPGVWGNGGPSSLWSFPETAIPFSLITFDLQTLESHAVTDGIYLAPTDHNNPANEKGYYLHFNANPRTVDIYKVKQLRGVSGDYIDKNGVQKTDTDKHDIQTPIQTPNVSVVQMSRSIPASGIIFAEDDVWVDGTISGHITVGSGRFPDNQSTWTTAVINGNILYTVQDGTDAFGLIAQKNILVPYYAPTNLEIDGVLIAQNGSVMRYFYSGNVLNGTITTYGSVITNIMWTWNWVSGGGTVTSGYKYTNTTYDSYLLDNPPPDLPTSSNQYNVLSWEEI